MDELSLLRRQVKRLAVELDYEAYGLEQNLKRLPPDHPQRAEWRQEARTKRACARQIRIILDEEGDE